MLILKALVLFSIITISKGSDWSTFEDSFCEFKEHFSSVSVRCSDFYIRTNDVKSISEQSDFLISNDENSGLKLESCRIDDFNAVTAGKISKSASWNFENCSISMSNVEANNNSNIFMIVFTRVNLSGNSRTNALQSFQNLKYYHAYNSKYPSTRIHKRFFPKSKIEIIKIVGSNLNAIDEDSFSDMLNLELLYIEHSPLQFISEKCCLNLPKLEIFRLRGNNLLTVGNSVFSGMTSMETLMITHNNLEIIKENMFTYNRKIRSLDFSHNKLNYIQESAFIGLRYLRTLDLYNNNLAQIDLYALKELEILNLFNNKFETVPDFSQLRKLRTLNLENNPLKIVYSIWFLPPSITYFDISNISAIVFKNCDYLKLYNLENFDMDNTEMLKFEEKCLDGNSVPICDSVKIEVEWAE